MSCRHPSNLPAFPRICLSAICNACVGECEREAAPEVEVYACVTTYAGVSNDLGFSTALIPLARRSGLAAVASAYDAGLSVAVLTERGQ